MKKKLLKQGDYIDYEGKSWNVISINAIEQPSIVEMFNDMDITSISIDELNKQSEYEYRALDDLQYKFYKSKINRIDKYIGACIISIVLGGAIFLSTLTYRKVKENRITNTFQVNSPKIQSASSIDLKDTIKANYKKGTVLTYEYDRIFGILSVKYSINDSTLENVSLEYLKNNYPLEFIMLTGDTINYNLFKPKKTIKILTKYISKKYNLKEDVIGKVLYDLELYLTLKK